MKKCSNCFKTSDFLAQIKNLSLKKTSFLQKKPQHKLQKIFLGDKNFYSGLPLCNLFTKKLSLPSKAKIKPALKPKTYQQYIRPESRSFYLLFINGVFQPKLSCYENFLTVSAPNATLLNKALNKEEGLGLLNLALGEKALLLTLEKDKKVKPPLQIINLVTEVTKQKAVFIAPILFFQIQENAGLEIVSEVIDLNLQSNPEPVFAPYTFFSLSKTAYVRYTSLNLQNAFWQNSFLRLFLEKEAHFSLAFFTSGGQIEMQDLKAKLKKGASLALNSLIFLKNDSQNYFHSQIEHAEEKSISSQLYKSVLDDRSRFFVNGEIYMKLKTEGSDGTFLNRNLILSSKAAVFAQPFLRIATDDVKAKHGVTSAKLSDEELFYLKSRGISQRAAQKCLLRGFCQEIKNLVKIKSINQSIEKAFYVDFKS